jgi:hypothetical protein
VLITVSIFARRYSSEGSTAAWAFGLLAAAQRAVEASGAQLLNEHADVAGHGWPQDPSRERHDH